MIRHPEIELLVITPHMEERDDVWSKLCAECPHLHLTRSARQPAELGRYKVIVTVGEATGQVDVQPLLDFVAAGGGWLVMNDLQEKPLPKQFGAQPAPAGEKMELRLLLADKSDPMAARLPEEYYIQGRYQPLQLDGSEVRALMHVDYQFTQQAVWSERGWGDGALVCVTIQDFSSKVVRKILHRQLCRLGGTHLRESKALSVGILGYAPSVGLLHGMAIEKVHGVELKAVCDLDEARLTQAQHDFPTITSYKDSHSLAQDPELDLVIIATPPNLHGKHCLELLGAGKHVLCEKPLALTWRETDAMREVAEQQGVHISCHQNRRMDPDYLAIRNAVERGAVGEIFHMETFVGGFNHPCNHWHSHDTVSGGTTFDWGAHYLDWIVSLMPKPIAAVQGSRHKRVWHDVTNGDQERILIRFDDGTEAEFMHSDIAAHRKPKWYILGTEGAIRSNWRDVTSYPIDPLYYYEQEDIPATEMEPELVLKRRVDSGRLEETKICLPPRHHTAFHSNLVDHLLWGEELAAPFADSAKVVAILEAAARSMANESRWEYLNEG